MTDCDAVIFENVIPESDIVMDRRVKKLDDIMEIAYAIIIAICKNPL